MDIESKEVDIESILSVKGKDFSLKTAIHIRKLFEKYGYDEVFGRSVVMEVTDLKKSAASKLLSNLVQADIIAPLSGYGKGKYKFKNPSLTQVSAKNDTSFLARTLLNFETL